MRTQFPLVLVDVTGRSDHLRPERPRTRRKKPISQLPVLGSQFFSAHPADRLHAPSDFRTVSTTLVTVPATGQHPVLHHYFILYSTPWQIPYIDSPSKPRLVTFQKTGIKRGNSRKFAFSSCAFGADICSGHLNSLERVLYEGFSPNLALWPHAARASVL